MVGSSSQGCESDNVVLYGCKDPEHKDVKALLPAVWTPASCRMTTWFALAVQEGEDGISPLP